MIRVGVAAGKSTRDVITNRTANILRGSRLLPVRALPEVPGKGEFHPPVSNGGRRLDHIKQGMLHMAGSGGQFLHAG